MFHFGQRIRVRVFERQFDSLSQPAALDLGVNHDIKSRVTYSVITKRHAR
jgi:hypothetical protein